MTPMTAEQEPGSSELKEGLSVVLATYNQGKILANAVEQFITSIKEASVFPDYEIIIVDDFSVDNSVQVAQSLRESHDKIKVLSHQRNLGAGAAYRSALPFCQFKHTLLNIGEFAHQREDFVQLLQAITSADFAVSYVPNLREIKNPLRYGISRTFTFILNFLYPLKLKYYNNPAIYRTEDLKNLRLKCNRHGCMAEINLLMFNLGKKPVEIGIRQDVIRKQWSTALRISSLFNVLKMLLYTLRVIYIGKLTKRLGYFNQTQPD